MSVAATSNILLIKLSAIGDLVMATPAIHALRELHPQAQIALLVGRWARPVIDGNPDLDEIIEIDESIFWKPKPFALLRLLLRLRGRHFTHGYNLHWSNLFNLFLLLLGIPERAGFSRDGRARFLTHSAPFTEGERGSHAIDHYLCLVTNEPQRFDRQPRIYLRDTERRIGVVKLSALRGDAASPVIAIAPGGGENPKSAMPLRRWPRERFVELARLILTRTNARILLLGSPGERILCDEIAAACPDPRVLTAAGQLSLRESAAVLAACRGLVCNDSGLMHIAGALDIPTLALFGPTAPWDKAPLGPRHRAFYRGLACSPCYRFGRFPDCPTQECLREISAEEVFASIPDLLQ